MCVVLPLIVLAVIVVILAARIAWRSPGDMGAALPSMLGTGLTLSSLVAPWVKFSPTAYVLPDILREVAPGIIAAVLRHLEHRVPARLVSLLESVGAIPGALLPILSYAGWGVRLVPVLVALIGILRLIWFPLTTFCSSNKRYVAAWIQAGTSLLAALLLLLEMPAIDTLVGRDHLWLGALAVLSGAHMGVGVWQAWLGLVLLSIGGVIDLVSIGGMRAPDDVGQPEY